MEQKKWDRRFGLGFCCLNYPLPINSNTTLSSSILAVFMNLTYMEYFFFIESFNLLRLLLMITLYYLTKTPISFWYRQGLNIRSFIQSSKTLFFLNYTSFYTPSIFFFFFFFFLRITLELSECMLTLPKLYHLLYLLPKL